MLKRSIFRAFFSLAFLLHFSSCDIISPSQPKPPVADLSEVLQTDRDFSDMSQHVGMKKAYLEYMSDDGAILRPGNPPLRGAEAVNYLSLVSDEGYELSWEPQGGSIASSGDLAYTFGIYSLKTEDITYQGTYTNIWKKENGKWKYVLNTSNEGISLNQ